MIIFCRNIFLITIFFFSVSFSQVKLEGFCAGLGTGMIKGNFPAVFTYSFNIGIDTKLFSVEDPSFRLNLLFTRDFNSVLPGERANRYYAYLQGISLSAVRTIHFYKKAYVEESAGIVVLNDRTFSDIDLMSYGAVVSLGVKIPLFDPAQQTSGLLFGLEASYGITFTNNTPQYFTFGLIGRYQL